MKEKVVRIIDHPKERDLNPKQAEYREIIRKHMEAYIKLNYNNSIPKFCNENSMKNNRSTLTAFIYRDRMPKFDTILRWMEATDSHIELVWKDLGKRQLLTRNFHRLSPFYEIWLREYEENNIHQLGQKYAICDTTLIGYRPKPDLDELDNAPIAGEFYMITRILSGQGIDIEIKQGEFITPADPDELIRQLDELEKKK